MRDPAYCTTCKYGYHHKRNPPCNDCKHNIPPTHWEKAIPFTPTDIHRIWKVMDQKKKEMF